MSRPPTPAALALLGAGIQPKTLAEELGITPQAVSYQLAGKTAVTSEQLLEEIERRGGERLAAKVARLIRKTRAGRAAEDS